MMLTVDLSYMAFTMLRHVCFISVLLRGFLNDVVVKFCQIFFSTTIDMIIQVFINVVCHLG